MCGRLTLKTPPIEWTQLLLPLLDRNQAAEQGGQTQSHTSAQAFLDSWPICANWQPRFNIAPTQNLAAVLHDEENQLTPAALRWGLVPSWATDLKVGNRMINARAETLAEKRSFSSALSKRRCLIIADGYYEWQVRRNTKSGKPTKQACWITPANGHVMFLAGLWEHNKKATEDPSGVASCTIVTTGANEAMRDIHDRMPVMLSGAAAEKWLDKDSSVEEVEPLLSAAEDDFFGVHKICDYVNNVRNEGPQCLEPVAPKVIQQELF